MGDTAIQPDITASPANLLVARIEHTVASDEWDFTGLDLDADGSWLVQVNARYDLAAAAEENLSLQFNGNTGVNYRSKRVQDGVAAAEVTLVNFTLSCYHRNFDRSIWGQFIVARSLDGFTMINTDFQRNDNANTVVHEQFKGKYLQNENITRMRISAGGGVFQQLGSYIEIYKRT